MAVHCLPEKLMMFCSLTWSQEYESHTRPATLPVTETCDVDFVNSGRLRLVMNQAVMIGAGVRTSAKSWELSVCVSPLSCMWQDGGEHIHETEASL